jgi:hypothetical protein
MKNSTLKTALILVSVMMPIAAIAQEEPQHLNRSTISVHEITGSSDILRAEASVIDEPVQFPMMYSTAFHQFTLIKPEHAATIPR